PGDVSFQTVDEPARPQVHTPRTATSKAVTLAIGEVRVPEKRAGKIIRTVISICVTGSATNIQTGPGEGWRDQARVLAVTPRVLACSSSDHNAHDDRNHGMTHCLFFL